MKRFLFTIKIIILVLLLPMLSYANLTEDVPSYSASEVESYNHIVNGLAKKQPVHMDMIKSFLTGQLANILHEHVVKATRFPDRKVRQMDYKVIKETTMPAALLEIGYISNPTEESIMTSEDMQNKVAASIVKGIRQYMNLVFIIILREDNNND